MQYASADVHTISKISIIKNESHEKKNESRIAKKMAFPPPSPPISSTLHLNCFEHFFFFFSFNFVFSLLYAYPPSLDPLPESARDLNSNIFCYLKTSSLNRTKGRGKVARLNNTNVFFVCVLLSFLF